MSKNLTRKGLALGAAFALATTGLVAAPAQAADGVVLKANTGTILAVPVTETLTLNASLVPTLPAANIAQLKYRVVTDGSYVLKAVVTSANVANTAAYTNTDNASYVTGAGVDTDIEAEADNTQKWIAANVSTSKVLTPSTTPTTTNVNTLALSVDSIKRATGTSIGVAPAKDTATKTATVTAWIDSNLDGVVDAAEASQTVTVSFIKYSELASTTTIVAPVEGDTTVEARVAYTNVNNEQLTAGEVGVHFTKGDGTALDADESLVVKTGVTWDADNGYFKYTTGTVTALVKNEAIKVQPLVKNGGLSAADNTADVAEKFGTSATASIAARAAGSIVADTVDSVTTSVATAAATATGSALLNSSYAVKAVVKDNTTPTALALPNAAVSVSVTSTRTLSSTVTVTLNGTTYTANNKLPGATGIAKLATTTNASGEAIVNVTTAGLTANDDLVFVFQVENRTAQITITNAAATYTGYITNGLDGLTTTDGVAAPVNVIVRDQFGGQPANGKYVVTATWDTPFAAQATTASTSATSTFAPVVGGSANLSILDNGTGAGAHKYDIALKTLASDGSYSASADIKQDLRINIVDAADAAVGQVVVTDSGASVVTQNSTTKVYTDALVTGNNNNGELLLADMFGWDGREATTAAPDVSSAVGVTITGELKSAATATRAAVAVAGATVTLTSANLMFGYETLGVGNGGWVYSVGSITVPALLNGTFTVKAWSNAAGKQTVILTSNGVSSTLVLDKFDAAGPLTGTAWDLSGVPSVVQPGYSFSLSAKLTDKYGNPVTTNASKVKLSWNGPIFTVPGTLPATTDADGIIKFGVVPAANEVGTYTYTVSYAGADDTFDTTDDLTVTKSVTIGTVGNTGEYSSWTKKLDDNSAKIYAKNVVGAGKVQFFLNGKEIAWVRATSAADSKLRTANGAAYLVRTVEFAEGKNVLEVYVDGVRTTRTAYTK